MVAAGSNPKFFYIYSEKVNVRPEEVKVMLGAMKRK